MAADDRKTSLRVILTTAALLIPFAVTGGCASHGAASPRAAGQAAGVPTSDDPAPAATPAADASTAPVVTAATAAAPASPAAPKRNGTYGTRLTVSNGTSKVLMNGGEVDFGTEVHDLTWSPDGKRAAFIDGDGNLSVADPDGTGRRVVARNTDGARWSHPTWQVRAHDAVNQQPAEDNLIFTVTKGGLSTLVLVPATGGTPSRLPLGIWSGNGATPTPETQNSRARVGGAVGQAVYQHDEGTTTSVYLRDDYLRLSGGKILDDAAQPDLFVGTGRNDGNGFEVAFVRASQGHRHIFVTSDVLPGARRVAKATDLTPDASADCSAPVFSPDGAQVAFSTPDQIDIVDVAHPGRVTAVVLANGVAAFRP